GGVSADTVVEYGYEKGLPCYRPGKRPLFRVEDPRRERRDIRRVLLSHRHSHESPLRLRCALLTRNGLAPVAVRDGVVLPRLAVPPPDGWQVCVFPVRRRR